MPPPQASGASAQRPAPDVSDAADIRAGRGGQAGLPARSTCPVGERGREPQVARAKGKERERRAASATSGEPAAGAHAIIQLTQAQPSKLDLSAPLA